jgi:hypothetical protein
MKPVQRMNAILEVQPGSKDDSGESSAGKPGVAKVSHTLSAPLAARLEEFAFFQRVSESSVIEHALVTFFAQGGDDNHLGEILRTSGAGRRRKS